MSDYTTISRSSTLNPSVTTFTTTTHSSPELRPAPHPKLILDFSSLHQISVETARSLLEAVLSPTLPVQISAVDLGPHTEVLVANSAIVQRFSYRPKSRDEAHFSSAPAPGKSVPVGSTSLLIPVGTKVATASAAIGAGRGELKPEAVRRSAKNSFVRMGLSSSSLTAERDGGEKSKNDRKRSKHLNTLDRYELEEHRGEGSRLQWLIAQRPDVEVSTGEIAGGFSGLVGEGICEEWGVRDFPLRDIKAILNTCERHHLKAPTVYQGEYNVLCKPSEELLQSLRKHQVRFHAYAPTASGALDSLVLEDTSLNYPPSPMSPTVSTFESPAMTALTRPISSSSSIRPVSSSSSSRPPTSSLSLRQTPSVPATAWRTRFDTPSAREAIKIMRQTAQQNGLPSASGLGLRWLAYHSQLSTDDAILIAAKNVRDLENKLGELAKGPLSEDIIERMGVAGKMMSNGGR